MCFSLSAGDTTLTLDISEARFYFTQNLTEWERRSVAWDLFQYGQEVLEKVSQPSYSFTVDSADFLVMDEFETFKSALSLGKRVYLKLDDGRVLTPLLLGFSHTFDEKSGLTLEFSNKFTSSNENDRLVDLLEQSVSMGKKLDLSRDINAFQQSNAHTVLDDYMNNMLNLAVKAILSEKNEVVSINENGIRLMKWLDDTHSAYDPHQIWMTHGGILFTDTAWEGAEDKPGAMMGIGHFVDDNLGEVTGVIAPNVVGSLLAGEQLYIYSTKPDGEHMSFTVDGSGVTTYNSHQQWIKPKSETGSKFDTGIVIDPKYGLFMNDGTHPLYKNVAGADPVPYCWDIRKNELTLKDGVPEGMNVWIGVDGKLYIKGNIYAESGTFRGTVEAEDFKLPSGESFISILNDDKQITGDWLDLRGVHVYDNSGTETMTIDGDTGITILNGKLTAPEITGGNIYGANLYAGDKSGSYAHMDGDSLRLYVKDVLQPKVKIDVGWNGSEPRIDLGAGDGFDNQVFSFVKHGTQGVIQYSGTDTNCCMLVFNEDGSIYPFGGTFFAGTWDFSKANVKGIHLTLA